MLENKKELDTILYKKINSLYSKGFQSYLNDLISFEEYDNKITNSSLYFSPSITAPKLYKDSLLHSSYLYLLNLFYIEKLNLSDINILKDKETIDNEIIEIVKRTYKDILKKDGTITVSYGNPTPDSIVKNGTLVLNLCYGKNKESFDKEAFKEVILKQRAFLKEFTQQLELEIKNKLQIDAKILTTKIV